MCLVTECPTVFVCFEGFFYWNSSGSKRSTPLLFFIPLSVKTFSQVFVYIFFSRLEFSKRFFWVYCLLEPFLKRSVFDKSVFAEIFQFHFQISISLVFLIQVIETNELVDSIDGIDFLTVFQIVFIKIRFLKNLFIVENRLRAIC